MLVSVPVPTVYPTYEAVLRLSVCGILFHTCCWLVFILSVGVPAWPSVPADLATKGVVVVRGTSARNASEVPEERVPHVERNQSRRPAEGGGPEYVSSRGTWRRVASVGGKRRKKAVFCVFLWFELSPRCCESLLDLCA